MGTTLTGTTPQDTYDSLIKVTDNGPLSGTLKKLTDGLGNDSALSLSTVSASLTGASGGRILTLNAPTDGGSLVLETGGAAFADVASFKAATGTGSATDFYIGTRSGNSLSLATAFTTRLFISSTGNVGIGTTAPSVRLTAKGDSANTQTIGGITVEQCAFFLRSNETASLRVAFDASANAYVYSSESGGILSFGTRTAPNNNIIASVTPNGLTFNGDTAAANALDDYEEGTWTISAAPSGSGTITFGSGANAGSYTKIGRQVTVTGLAEVDTVSSPVGSVVIFSGLPFPISAGNLDYDSRIGGSVTLNSAGSIVPRALAGFENQSSFNVYVDASTIASANQFYISFTYIV